MGGGVTINKSDTNIQIVTNRIHTYISSSSYIHSQQMQFSSTIVRK